MGQTCPDSDIRKQCIFVVKKKNRQCRMLALKNSMYCGEHVISMDKIYTEQQDSDESQRRIPCPLDGTHTCFARNLQRHLRVCNARVTHVPAYHVQDINAGDGPSPVGSTVHQLTDGQLMSLLEKIGQLYRERVCPVTEEYGEHRLLADSLCDEQLGADSLKHLRQNAAILALMQRHGLLDGAAPRTYVELGSGKAHLSSWVARAVAHDAARILLVDRASHRHKAENKLKDDPHVCPIQRLRIDIRHLKLAACEQCAGRRLVVVSKHLCGAATDLGLRAALCGWRGAGDSGVPAEATDTTPSATSSAATEQKSSNGTGAPDTGPGPSASETGHCPPTEAAADGTVERGPAADGGAPSGRSSSSAGVADAQAAGEGASSLDVEAILIALCCHHRLDWSSYVGKQFIEECGWTGADLAALRGVAAWATCSTPSWDAPPPKRRRLRGAHPQPGGSDVSGAAEPAGAARTPAAASGAGADVASLQRNPAGDSHTSGARYQRLGLTPQRRTQLGFWCKRLLDEGRRRYLAAAGLGARLVQFVPDSVSPENVLLLAWRAADVPGSAVHHAHPAARQS